MFDTKIYHQFGCNCLDCHKIGCICDYHISHTPCVTARQTIIEQNIYNKGFYDGQNKAWEEHERERYLFKNCSDQQKMVELLKDLIKKIENN